jgi:hypothetical protein
MKISGRRPLVKTMLLCLAATLNPATNRYSLSEVFHRIDVTGFPCAVPPMIAYIAMTEVQGRHRCGLYLNDLESGQEMVGREGSFGGTRPTDLVELALQVLPSTLSDVPPLVRAGMYEVAFLVDEQRAAYCLFVVREG